VIAGIAVAAMIGPKNLGYVADQRGDQAVDADPRP
jgi:hypothetical protein